MRRGDLVTVAVQGDFGKPRPALIIQADRFPETKSLTVLPLTSNLREAPLLRIPVEPTTRNGLRRRSHIMIDKPTSLVRDKVGSHIGRVDDDTMVAVNRSLVLFLGIA